MGQIYKTTNLINGKIYIGKDETSNPNYLGSGKAILAAIEKYGRENFIKEILEECEDGLELCYLEQKWIQELKSQDNEVGYNIHPGGHGGRFVCGGDTISYNPMKDEIFKKRTLNNPDMYKKIVDTRRLKGSYVLSDERKQWLSTHNSMQNPEARKKVSDWNKKNSPVEATFVILDTITNQQYIIKRIHGIKEFIDNYNKETKLPYRNRINYWKLYCSGIDKNMVILNKQTKRKRNDATIIS